jgi:hypothetical protein
VDVKRHDVNGGVDSGTLEDVFYVKGPKGKLTDGEIKSAITVLEGIVKTQAAAARSGVRPKFQTQTIAPDPAKREVLYAIMGGFVRAWAGTRLAPAAMGALAGRWPGIRLRAVGSRQPRASPPRDRLFYGTQVGLPRA